MTAKEFIHTIWICEPPKGSITVADVIEAMEKYAKHRNPSIIKEKLYQGIIKRELKDKYRVGSSDEGKIVTQCRACGKVAALEDGILIQGHYWRCPTAQMERVVAL